VREAVAIADHELLERELRVAKRPRARLRGLVWVEEAVCAGRSYRSCARRTANCELRTGAAFGDPLSRRLLRLFAAVGIDEVDGCAVAEHIGCARVE
jgi:hypothetical protein